MYQAEEKYKVYKKIRGKGQILNLNQNLAYIFLASSIASLFTLVIEPSIKKVSGMLTFIVILYFFLLFLSKNERRWEIFQSEKIPDEIDLR